LSRMADTFSKPERSRIMRAVRSTGTSAELRCEAILRALKLDFRQQVAALPGKPDFVLTAPRLALFVHGCFWHGHHGCEKSAIPSSNVKYWTGKIARNRTRDARVRNALRKAGWRTAVIWECKLQDTDSVTRRLLKLAAPDREKLR
jgi:DNA mismatch endonuclease, patch repair protein